MSLGGHDEAAPPLSLAFGPVGILWDFFAHNDIPSGVELRKAWNDAGNVHDGAQIDLSPGGALQRALSKRPMTRKRAIGEMQLALGLLTARIPDATGDGLAQLDGCMQELQRASDAAVYAPAGSNLDDALAARVQQAVLDAFGADAVISEGVNQELRDTALHRAHQAADAIANAFGWLLWVAGGALVVVAVVGGYVVYKKVKAG